MPTIEDLIERVRSGGHRPGRPCELPVLRAVERKLGWTLPDDLVRFIEQCDGAALFPKGREAAYTFVPIESLERTRVAILGEDSDEVCPASWFALVDVLDGNYLSIDLDVASHGCYRILDTFHETLGERGYDTIVARSFSEFLELALDSGGAHFYLDEDFEGYGSA